METASVETADIVVVVVAMETVAMLLHDKVFLHASHAAVDILASLGLV
jgi:hypothetical protein